MSAISSVDVCEMLVRRLTDLEETQLLLDKRSFNAAVLTGDPTPVKVGARTMWVTLRNLDGCGMGACIQLVNPMRNSDNEEEIRPLCFATNQKWMLYDPDFLRLAREDGCEENIAGYLRKEFGEKGPETFDENASADLLYITDRYLAEKKMCDGLGCGEVCVCFDYGMNDLHEVFTTKMPALLNLFGYNDDMMNSSGWRIEFIVRRYGGVFDPNDTTKRFHRLYVEDPEREDGAWNDTWNSAPFLRKAATALYSGRAKKIFGKKPHQAIKGHALTLSKYLEDDGLYACLPSALNCPSEKGADDAKFMELLRSLCPVIPVGMEG